MSTLKVGTIADHANGNSAITIDSNGNTSIPSGRVLNAPGHILQVKSASHSEPQTLTLDAYEDIVGLSLTITPASTSSKILVMASVCYGSTGANNYGHGILMRDSTVIGIGSGATGNRINVSFPMDLSGSSTETYKLRQASATFLDSPNTTSSTIYKVRAYHAVNGTMYINRSGQDSNADYGLRGISTLTLMEVAG